MNEYAAEISTGVVTQIINGNYIVANQEREGKWVDCTTTPEPSAGISWIWNGTDFVAPTVDNS
jgi:hypothetical protein